MIRSKLYGLVAAIASALFLVACGAPDHEDNMGASLIRGVNFVGMTVSDLDRTEAFYMAATDMRRVEEAVLIDDPVLRMLTGRSDVRVETRMLRGANAQVRLMAFDTPSQAAQSTPPIAVQGPGIAHMCYQVGKQTQAYQRFLTAGATPIGARDMVQLSARNPVEYAYIRDPDGIVLEVEHVDTAALDLPMPPKTDYRIRHVSLGTPDIDRLTDFYAKLLNQPKPRRLGSLFPVSGEKVDQVSGLPGSKLKMTWFQTRNLELEIIQYVSHPTVVPEAPRPIDAHGYNMIVFDVTDIEAVQDQLLSAGGMLVSDVNSMDGGTILFGRDPDGNLLGFQTVADDAVVSSQHFDGNGT